ncbi:protein unc-13 homolog 4B-like [Sitophilus oryzae]|uniref:Protein unc-13 homolog 4B-like n=1 Tax=Sitophilus oryzae TaxID=7048 RepID=A0A6J2Y6R4_SITOR|nr:protein unc-13 homolog 4B-like [Sitophilus oryzae]
MADDKSKDRSKKSVFRNLKFKNFTIKRRSQKSRDKTKSIPEIYSKKDEKEENNSRQTVGYFEPTQAKNNLEEEYDFQGTAIEELYQELLYVIINQIGSKINKRNLFLYIKEVFKITDDNHKELLSAEEEMEKPQLIMNVEILEINKVDEFFEKKDILNDLSLTLDIKFESSGQGQKEYFFSLTNTREKYSVPVHIEPFNTLELVIRDNDKKEDSNLIGKSTLLLNEILTSTSVTHYKISRNKENVLENFIEIEISFGYRKATELALNRHKLLRKLLLEHELKHSEIAPYWWCRTISYEAEELLIQHSVQNMLNHFDLHLVSLIVYTEIHIKSPLNFSVFADIIEKIMKTLQNSEVDERQLKKIWQALRILVPTCFEFIGNIRDNTLSQNTIILQLFHPVYVLYRYVRFDYAKQLYIFYQDRISALFESKVRELSNNFKKLDYVGCNIHQLPNRIESIIDDPLPGGSLLLRLYFNIQKFFNFGKELFKEKFKPVNFHEWFHQAVIYWLDASAYTALMQIEKAIEIDNLEPCGNSPKYSSSAGSTVNTFYKIRNAWEELNWPDYKEKYHFIIKIIDDIVCKEIIYYIDVIRRRTDQLETDFITWSLIINNIEYLKKFLSTFVEDFGLDSIIEAMSMTENPSKIFKFREKKSEIVAKTISIIESKILLLIESFSEKMKSVMKQLLSDNSSTRELDISNTDIIILYIDDNLSLLICLQKEVSSNYFNEIIEKTGESLLNAIEEVIHDNKNKNKPSSYYINLENTLNDVLYFFKKYKDISNSDKTKQTKILLSNFGSETEELIHRVNLKINEYYETFTESSHGELFVKCKFDGNRLIIKVLSVRILMAVNSNDTIRPFVTINLLPAHKFAGTDQNLKTKTRVHQNSKPSFDQSFTINLTPEQMNRCTRDALILFTVKHKVLLYKTEYVGEGFLRFAQIPSMTERMRDTDPVKILLLRPDKLDADILNTLQCRTTDTIAMEFLKELNHRHS